jgi:hypothetical protein
VSLESKHEDFELIAISLHAICKKVSDLACSILMAFCLLD